MIDTKLLLRKAYFQTLAGNLTYLTNTIPVTDSITKLGNTINQYVLMTQNTSQEQNTQNFFQSLETFELQIVFIGTRVNKQVVDIIANQILNLVCPNPQANGLSQQPGCWIDNVRRSGDFYDEYKLLNAQSVIRRVITFSQTVTETDFGSFIPGGGSSFPFIGLFKYVSADFTNATDLIDPALTGYNLAVFWNDIPHYLDTPSEWLPITGGFRIVIPGFDSTIHSYTFYVGILSN